MKKRTLRTARTARTPNAKWCLRCGEAGEPANPNGWCAPCEAVRKLTIRAWDARGSVRTQEDTK